MASFTISLDFELYWGVSDSRKLLSYKENIDGTWDAIPKILELFLKYNINATWATVGMLMCKDYKDWEYFSKRNKENIYNTNLIKKLKPLIIKYPNAFFARELVEKIIKTQGQEIATHTYSHISCDDSNISEKDFLIDIKNAVDVADTMDIELQTIVFPRNQINKNYFNCIKEYGFKAYRDNPNHNLYKFGHSNPYGIFGRFIRFINSYLPIIQNKYFLYNYINSDKESIKGSFFLRPWSRKLFFLEFLKIYRIKSLMTNAAKQNLNFHLWWHPHNFGSNLVQNIINLEKILMHYKKLNNKYNFKSCSMIEIHKL